MYVPEWIYRLLPFVYVAAGLYAAWSLGSTLGVACGLLLALAGGLIARMRREARTALTRR
jgi:hypothetical protein